MPHPLNSSLNGWGQALAGTSVAWAESVADDDVGPTREPMRSSKRLNGNTRAAGRTPGSMSATSRQQQAVKSAAESAAASVSGSAV
jgi:hypothetical protein